VFLGDNHPNRSTLDQGAWYYYRTYANKDGYFTIPNVREGRWNIQAWPNGGNIGNVTTVFSMDDVSTKNGTEAQLGELKWQTQGRKPIWQVGEIDRKATGFAFSGPPHEHARQTRCPANLTFEIGKSHAKDWCFSQWSAGTWSIHFDITALDMKNIPQVSSSTAAILSVSLAGYSAGVGSSVMVNNSTIGRLPASKVTGDPSLYRSGTLAGEWRLFEFPVKAGAFKEGWNTVEFVVTKSEAWKGYMFDSILLEWA
jgi:rhamnogalacturonan endolyase